MGNIQSFINDDDIQYEYLSWQELGDIATVLATKVLADKLHFDRLIALATGGHTMSKAIKDYLYIPKISSLQISFYSDIAKTNSTPIITQSIGASLENQDLLIFDDVNDSGRTIKMAKEYLLMRGARSLHVATLVSKSKTNTPSDYFGHHSDNWIIFPDEVRETITLLTAKWSKQKLSSKDIYSRLLQIGFSPTEINLINNSQ